jgi:chemotaxis response regulator CheB
VIRDHGGLALVEDPAKAAAPQMPMAALASDDPEVLPLELLARRVARFCSRQTVP